MGRSWEVAIDIGGTFTDLLIVDRSTGRHSIEKVLTTHGDLMAGVIDGFDLALAQAGLAAEQGGMIAHATTLVTNAVIERSGAATALLVTEGFRDILSIGREHRYDMYDVRLEKPAPLVTRLNTFEVPERVLADGTVHHTLDEDAVRRIAVELAERGVEAVAVCLLHAYRFPGHERRAGEILRERLPKLHVTLSHEVVGELREYERGSTTVANAYVLGLVDSYVAQLEGCLAGPGHNGQLFVMLSNGAVATAATARQVPVRLIESGPAAGALAAAEAGRRMDRQNLLSFDMGGTTAKACFIQDGRPEIGNQLEVARLQRFRRGSGLPLEISSVKLIEIGAGGGSHARIDQFGLLQVGPDSAGSQPGPVCYGRGGSIPTVTDADLHLGYLDPEFFLGGRMRLDVEAARTAIEQQLARPLGLDGPVAAWTVHEVVNENMANAARIHAVERGVDLRELPLFAFGGAGPVHAHRVARNLGLSLVIAPLSAGIGSTIGLLAAPMAFDFVRSHVTRLGEVDWEQVGHLLDAMEDDGKRLLSTSGVDDGEIGVEYAIDMRLVGQAHEIAVELEQHRPSGAEPEGLDSAFGRTYEKLFGRQPPDVAIEAVSWRVRVSGPRPPFPIRGSEARAGHHASDALKSHRPAYFPEADGFTRTPVYDRNRLAPGMVLPGPAIVEERESTFIIGPDGRGMVDEFLNLLVEV